MTAAILLLVLCDAAITVYAVRWMRMREVNPIVKLALRLPGGLWWLTATHGTACALVLWGQPHGIGGAMVALAWVWVLVRNLVHIARQLP